MIPIYIISYNNGYYVENTINQLVNKGVKDEQIHIIDNHSIKYNTTYYI